ncbi:hypothetical protein HDV57DRAFT_306503 [Trichoderma longibrachiatum]
MVRETPAAASARSTAHLCEQLVRAASTNMQKARRAWRHPHNRRHLGQSRTRLATSSILFVRPFVALCLLWLCSAGGLHLSAAPSSGPLQILNHGAACFLFSPHVLYMSGPPHLSSGPISSCYWTKSTRSSEEAHCLNATKHRQDSRLETTFVGEADNDLR